MGRGLAQLKTCARSHLVFLLVSSNRLPLFLGEAKQAVGVDTLHKQEHSKAAFDWNLEGVLKDSLVVCTGASNVHTCQSPL